MALRFEELAAVYEKLAGAIDALGPQERDLVLTQLSLTAIDAALIAGKVRALPD